MAVENIINRNLQNIQDPDTEMNQMIPEANNFAFDIGSRVAPLGTFFAGTDYRSSNMDKNIMDIISNQGTQKGTIGYQDYDPKQPSNTAFPDLDGMMSRYLSGEISPSQFGNATQTGRMNYNLDPDTGQYNFTGNKYDFRPDVADQGGIFGYFANKANERGMNINPGSSTKAGYLSDYEAGEHYNMTPEPADAISRTNFNDSYNYNDVDALTADEQAQLPFDRITPQQTMFGKARDLASAGIGKAGKLGMDAFNMLKNNNPLGFVSSLVNTRNPLSPGSSNYNSNLQGQINSLKGQTGTRITGTSDNLKFTDGLSMINGNKYGLGSVLSGKNVTSGFGTNDYELSLEKYIEKMMSYKTRSKFQQAKLDRAKKELADEQGRQQSILDAAYASQSKASRDRQNAMTGGRYDGASSAQEYASDPGKGSTFSGSSKDGGVMGYGGKSGTPRYAQFKEGGKIDAKSFLDMIDVKASGSKSGKQQIQGAPKGITMDNESINAIVRADIPISEKIDILASYGYGKDRSKVEKDNEELFLGEGGYKDRNVGMGFNKDGEGIGGTMTYNIETGDPEFKIRFKKNFSKGGRVGFKKGGLATMFKLKG